MSRHWRPSTVSGGRASRKRWSRYRELRLILLGIVLGVLYASYAAMPAGAGADRTKADTGEAIQARAR